MIVLWGGRLLAVGFGAAAGYLLHGTVGCRTGACPMTANPWISTLYGAFLGGMLAW